MKIAIYSGSFNPIHNGHLAIAEAALAEGFDEVWLVVSPQNPHKKSEELWPFEERYKMVELAVLNLSKIKAKDFEANLPLPSYTIKTLEFLKEEWPQHQFSLLIGGDNLLKFHLWKEYQRIIDQFGLVIYPRSTGLAHPFDNRPNVRTMHAPLLDISSSDIRKRISENKSVVGLVPAEVEKFIRQKLKSDLPESDF